MNKTFKTLTVLAITLGIFSLVIALFFSFIVLKDSPSLDSLKNYQPLESTRVYDKNGLFLGKFYDERRTVIDTKKLPSYVLFAFVSAEDSDFYIHKGIDLSSLTRAVLQEIKYLFLGGRRVGGSTITQQTARTMLLSTQRTYLRKIKEILLALKIERSLSKQEILHLYLNQIYFGHGAYGIEEASKTYFHKSAKNLEIFEASLLASIPKSPNRINPFSDIKRLKQRQRYVLDQMVKNGYISQLESDNAFDRPIFSGTKKEALSPNKSLYFLESVKAELLAKNYPEDLIKKSGLKVYSTLDLAMQNQAEESLKRSLESLDKKYGYQGPIKRVDDPKQLKAFMEKLDDTRSKLFTTNKPSSIWSLCHINPLSSNFDVEKITVISSLKPAQTCGIITNVDEKKNTLEVDLGSQKILLKSSDFAWAIKQTSMTKVFKKGDIVLLNLTRKGGQLFASLEQKPRFNAGLITLDVKTGGVLAMVGGYEFKESQFNRITQSKRQVGSIIKPFIYALALNKDLITPASIITDSPRAFLDPVTGEFWKPKNHNNKFLGDITVRRCLRSSINICTISVLEKLGIDNLLDFTKTIHLNTKETPYPRNLTIALGSAENSPFQIANALRIFPNEGLYSPSHMLLKLEQKDGTITDITPPKPTQVLSPESAFMITWILKDTLSQKLKSTYLDKVSVPMAGKTGTTNEARTTWFYGFTPNILTLVYVGYDDNRSMGKNVWGINTAFPIWADYMNSLQLDSLDEEFLAPDGIQWQYIHQNTGKAVEGFDPFEDEEPMLPKEDIIKEAFKEGIPLPNQSKPKGSIRFENSPNSVFAP